MRLFSDSSWNIDRFSHCFSVLNERCFFSRRGLFFELNRFSRIVLFSLSCVFEDSDDLSDGLFLLSSSRLLLLNFFDFLLLLSCVGVANDFNCDGELQVLREDWESQDISNSSLELDILSSDVSGQLLSCALNTIAGIILEDVHVEIRKTFMGRLLKSPLTREV